MGMLAVPFLIGEVIAIRKWDPPLVMCDAYVWCVQNRMHMTCLCGVFGNSYLFQ
jgi:hypothetical protein